MRRRDWLGGLVFLLGGFPAGVFTSALAEFGVGLGEIEKSTSAASASFNEGLSSFHLMLAALAWISHTYLVQSAQAPRCGQILPDSPHAVGRVGGPRGCGSRMASLAVLHLA